MSKHVVTNEIYLIQCTLPCVLCYSKSLPLFQGYQNHFQGSSYGGPPQQGHGYMHMGSGAQNIHSPQRPPNGPPQGIDPTIWEWFKASFK